MGIPTKIQSNQTSNRGKFMIPKMINTFQFLGYCEREGISGYNNGKKVPIHELLQKFDEYETQKDIKRQLKKLVVDEIKLYERVPKMTSSAFADHMLTKLLSDNGLTLINKYIELKKEE